MVGFVSWWPERLFWLFQYSYFYIGFQAELIRLHCPSLWIFCLFVYWLVVWLVFVLFCWCICNHKSLIEFDLLHDIHVAIISRAQRVFQRLRWIFFRKCEATKKFWMYHLCFWEVIYMWCIPFNREKKHNLPWENQAIKPVLLPHANTQCFDENSAIDLSGSDQNVAI